MLIKKNCVLGVLTLISCIVYLTINVNPEAIGFAMQIRLPNVLGMIVAATCLGTGTIIFQTLVNNRVLTPCILGLTPLYILTQTVIVFFLGSSSIFVMNATGNFFLSLGIMLVCSMIIYRVLFERQKQNILLLLLIGTVLGTFFASFSGFLQRVIDPNEFLTLQNRLFASFRNINSEILMVAAIVLFLLFLWCRRDLVHLNIMALGKEQAINLGVPYQSLVKKYMLVVTVLVSLATAIVGPITFLGFLITNITHELLKTYRHGYLICGSILLGCFTLLLGQTLIEQVFMFDATLTSIINFAGGIYFILLVMRQKV